jgi:hypothetical protein
MTVRRLRVVGEPPVPAACRWHLTEEQRLPYLAWHARAERSRRRGERQTRCPGCSKWIFPWERVPGAAS